MCSQAQESMIMASDHTSTHSHLPPSLSRSSSKVNECVRALVAYVKKRDKRGAPSASCRAIGCALHLTAATIAVASHQAAAEEEKKAREAKIKAERVARQMEADEARRLQARRGSRVSGFGVI